MTKEKKERVKKVNNPRVMLKEVDSIVGIRGATSSIKGFLESEFKESVDKEIQIIFDYLTTKKLCIWDKERLPKKHKKDCILLLQKKIEITGNLQKPIAEIVEFHFDSSRNISYNQSQYLTNPLSIIIEIVSYSNFYYESITSILIMLANINEMNKHLKL